MFLTVASGHPHPRPTAADLHALLAEYAEADAVTVARGLVAPWATAHQVRLVSGREVHTWCALDALLVARLLECDVHLSTRAPYPGDGPLLRVAIEGGRLRAEPAYVLSFPHVGRADGTHFTDAFCPYANVFGDASDYAAWAPRQPRPTTPIDLHQADAIAREYAADVLSRRPAAYPLAAEPLTPAAESGAAHCR